MRKGSADVDWGKSLMLWRAENWMAKGRARADLVNGQKDEQLMRCKVRMDGCQQYSATLVPGSDIEETGKHRIWSGLCCYYQCKLKERKQANEKDRDALCNCITPHLLPAVGFDLLWLARELNGTPMR